MILEYFIPGFIGIQIFSVLTARKFKKNYMYILSCAYSYVCIILISSIGAMFNIPLLLTNNLVISALAIVLCVSASCVFSLIIKLPSVNQAILNLYHRTLNDNIWLDIFNFNGGTNLKVYLKDKDYFIIGQYRRNEEKGDDSWFVLSGYVMCDIKTNTVIPTANYLNNKNIFIAFRLKDVDRMEIFNNPDKNSIFSSDN